MYREVSVVAQITKQSLGLLYAVNRILLESYFGNYLFLC